MPDPVTTIFQTTLLVLYFITPAATVHLKPGQKEKEKFETTKVWTLQSTSQISTENPNMCAVNGKLLLQKFEQVSTVTVRAFCLCPEHLTGSGDICDKAQQESVESFSKSNKVTEDKARELAPPDTIVPIGPDTPMPSSRTLKR